MTSRRGTSNSAIRGNAEQRRRSKRALLARDGDGEKAPCWECGTLVDFETMIRDKIKAGRDGGRYVLKNLRIHCRRCSELQGHRLGLETRRWRAWEKRGLRMSRIASEGLTADRCWYVFLDGRRIGFVEPWPKALGGGWRAFRTTPWRIVGAGRTRREALYALLVECTTKPRRKA